MLDFSILNSSFSNPTWISIVYAFLLSFVLGTVLAVIYVKTFRGLSYSLNFLHGLVLLPIVIAIAMQAIGDNVARGIGMIGALSLLRFRTNVKDPRDMFFIFASLAVGLASGVHAYGIAILGTGCFVIALLVLQGSSFAAGPQFDGLLRFNLARNPEQQRQIENVLEGKCRHFALATIREMGQGDRLDFSYQVRLKPQTTSSQLIEDLGKVDSVRGLNFMNQESVIEV
ncbi:DUF4956 domain-containing protein [Bdellovibrio bacteriovorus]|uniref:DUF4956 domain-containing protein n=1 Tax=Bdellovibrio bacteriovorus TaxID=959 RepID=A0A150WGV5_BDEBC|nr:DUF4956 domain-containing protein [Bdellovibrio bacteriovorus]KYG62204.1 hypothetical protein AZI85_08420 [Bdellovibrio bacteriovorus]KYG68391.1 hypothetical protein AZI87_03840 [Bdellovibrio bacteriovorus]